ncbi:PstS family phosphate ABC transporter substrate-binding protein [Fischerella thermalis]|jgi:phosphate transport system substrate-binding protein|uniref:Phosphate-binding protein n=2 Tax=Fischerella TaxID=1190 RepID=G6FNN2_9CYAN|nr:PstS family phosphate ABC transporter substrate-binding protein [Fischerella thermalis]PMB04195.1 phosphate-binding protein [Fischerella thermalis CCMEE 5328]EHC19662.1 phosphate binding protein [Fischerella thermalis JSC-11]PLZ05170.1 phosphate-binding protein [Fischerella thermalis WC1110]PLZ10028.1 phosphate-binding protein [Fischerella thermalis WC114]PLZ15222.1 phosphate-binding protein [Fischerella thermalis WC119]
MFTSKVQLVAPLVVLSMAISACGDNQATNNSNPAANGNATPAANTAAGSNLSGKVTVDGSSTVFPISEAMAEEFQKANPGVQVTVGSSGTGGGFKKFCNNETDISNASRPIKPEEVELCKKNNVEYIELPVAFDGLSVVVNPQNNFVKCLTVAELKKMWEPAAQGKVTSWRQIRPDFPDQRLGLYGAGTDSGTYDFFTKAIVGAEGKSRGDYTASEDDNTLVQGVSSDTNGIGFFGLAYYENNKDKLKLVAIDNGKGCVLPSAETVADGTYQPLSRPEFIYVKKSAATRPEVKAFVDFHLAEENQKLVKEVGYVPLPQDIISEVQERFNKGKVGSVFEGQGSTVGVTLKDLLKKEK